MQEKEVGFTNVDAHATSVLFSVLAQALLNEPMPSIVDDVVAVARALSRNDFQALPGESDLTQRYYDRFFVPASSSYIPLVENSIRSCHEAPDGFAYGPLVGACSDHVLRCYKAVGFDEKKLQGYAAAIASLKPDSLASELAFIAYLKQAEAAADTAETTEHWAGLAQQFAREHLLGWLPQAVVCMHASGEDFYTEVCAFAAEATDALFSV